MYVYRECAKTALNDTVEWLTEGAGDVAVSCFPAMFVPCVIICYTIEVKMVLYILNICELACTNYFS